MDAKEKAKKLDLKVRNLNEYSTFQDDIIFTVNLNYEVTFFNNVFKERLTNYYKTNIAKSLALKDLITIQSDFDILYPAFTKAFKGKSFYLIENFSFNKDSSYEVFLNPIYDASNKVIAAVAFFRNLNNYYVDDEFFSSTDKQLRKVAKVLDLGLVIQKVVYDKEKNPIDTRFITLNKKYELITGIKLKEVEGKKLSEVIPDAKEGSTWIDKYVDVITKAEVITFDHYAPFIQKWFRITAYSPLKDHLALLLTDISAEREANIKLIRSEELYRTTVDGLMAGVVVCNAMGDVISANPKAIVSPFNIVVDGKIPFSKEVLPIYNENKELIKVNDSPIVKAAQTKEAVVNQIIGTISRDSGEFVWINVSIIPLLDNDGEIERFIINFLDITKRKKMEDKIVEDKNTLFAQKQLAEATLMAISEGVVSTDAQGYIQSFNASASELTEWTQDETIGKKLCDVVHIYDENNHKTFDYCLNEFNFKNFVKTKLNQKLISKSGKVYDVELNSSLITDINNKVIGLVVVFRNITDELELMHKLVIESQRLERVIEVSTDMLLEVDQHNNIINISGAGLSLIDVDPNELIGKNVRMLFTDNNDQRDFGYYSAVNGKQYGYEWRYTKKDGKTVWFDSTVSPIYDEKNNIIGILNIAKESTARKEKQVKTEFLSFHDELTKIHNRHYFNEKLKTFDQPDYFPLGIIMVDMNSLKLINDTLGHQKGDEALQTIATILKNSFRSEDVVTRIGGDEFAIILPNTKKEGLERRIIAIKEKFAETMIDGTPLSISMGYKIKKDLNEKMEDILKEAEEAMYEDKRLNSGIYHTNLLVSFRKNLYDLYPSEMVHQKTVELLCNKMAKSLQLENEDKERLLLSAKVFDIGKLFIPANIYTKSKKLTTEERKVVEKHSYFAYNVVKLSSKYAKVADIVLHHHENFDGSGYPYSLKGGDIPYLARILTICDSYSAMILDRPYRPKLTKKEALAELLRLSGTKYDPVLVAEFIKLF